MKSKKEKAEIRDNDELLQQPAENEAVKAEAQAAGAQTAKAGQTVEPIEEKNEQEKEIEALKTQLEEKTKQCNDYYSALQRAAAEFDNYKKRTAREKEALYTDAVCDVAAAFLPVIDSIDRAVQACVKDSESGSLKEGFDLVCRQAKDVLKNLGVEEIKSVNETFDPNLHNAVMHVEDEALGQGIVVEEFQKGYIYKEKVIRHSMVKVAN